LKEINFVFGSNGSGKTTVSRIVANPSEYPSCEVNWTSNHTLKTLVFNRDFLSRNFETRTELPGVFTLGEGAIDTRHRIEEKAKERDAKTEEIAKLEGLIGVAGESYGKQGELTELERRFTDQCWAQKKKHENTLGSALAGYRNSAIRFRGKVLQVAEDESKEVPEYEALVERASVIYRSDRYEHERIPEFDLSQIETVEQDSVITRPIVGSADVDIAALIHRLGNGDWVREGRTFLESSDGLCPFCQQQLPRTLSESLGKYFDESFEEAVGEIRRIKNAYEIATKRALSAMTEATNHPLVGDRKNALNALVSQIETIFSGNISAFDAKLREPTRKVKLDSTSTVRESIVSYLEAINEDVKKNNRIVANIRKEREDLATDVWRYIVNAELSYEIKDYLQKRESIRKAIESMRQKIASLSSERTGLISEINALERQTTSTQPTVDRINSILAGFGFNSFHLVAAPDGSSYQLLRGDGTDAKETLSEGEKNFVVFLYFYHLLDGSEGRDDLNQDRVVVVDDPVSSLDSDVLFIVSALLRDLFGRIRDRASRVKQVIVLTHNVYFHKEVTLEPRRRGDPLRDESFWIIRKPQGSTTIESSPDNPIRTSYELLWSELKAEGYSSITKRNVMRRILESYFRILGGIDLDDILTHLPASEKVIAGSLLSWVHDGSHSVIDDVSLTVVSETNDRYMEVFRSIFVHTNQIQHFEMMMAR
jgi:wobble nucleotide-excising tRNase